MKGIARWKGRHRLMQPAPWLLRDCFPLRPAFVGGVRLRRWVAMDGVLDRLTRMLTDSKMGLSRGCALSPLMGTFNRHTLGRAMRMVNRILTKLDLERHRDKTFMGKSEPRKQAARLRWKRVSHKQSIPALQARASRLAAMVGEDAWGNNRHIYPPIRRLCCWRFGV